MSNYIKIPMEDGTGLTGTQTVAGGGTISGYDARNGVEVFTSTGQGSGATVNITMDGRALSSVPLTGWGGSTATASGAGATAATGTGGTGTGVTDPTFTVENNGGDAEVTLVGAGDNLIVDDVITIPADVVSGTSKWTDPLTYTVTDSDLEAAVVGDLICTASDAGEGYADGDTLFLDIQASGPADEISWDAVLTITVSGLSGYDDGPYVLLPAGNVLCTIPNPMSGSAAVVAYANVQGVDAGITSVNKATITFSGITTAAERLSITQELNAAILKANQAENSIPTLVLPTGVQGLQVAFS